MKNLEITASMYQSNVELYISNAVESIGSIYISNDNFDIASYENEYSELVNDIREHIANELVKLDISINDIIAYDFANIIEDVATHLYHSIN